VSSFDDFKKRYYSKTLIAVSAVALLLSAYLLFSRGGATRAQPKLGQLRAVCAGCGHGFELTNEQFRKANASERGAQTAQEPAALGVCPSCGATHIGYRLIRRDGEAPFVLALTEPLEGEELQRRARELAPHEGDASGR
jgi:hypothetical protein